MAKIAATFILVVIITVQGRPATYDEILAAARDGQWDQVQDFTASESGSDEDLSLHSNFAKNAAWKKALADIRQEKDPTASFNSVRELKPTDGGHVYGEAEYSFHSASNIGGKTSEDHEGHKIINNNGKVSEYDFTPSTESPLLQPIIAPSQGGNDYSAADYSFHYAPTGVAETADYIGGKKVVNKAQPSHLKLSTPNLPIPSTKLISEPYEKAAEDYVLQPGPMLLKAKNDQEVGNNNEKAKEIEITTSTTKSSPSLVASDGVTNQQPPQDGNFDGEYEYVLESTSASEEALESTSTTQKVINNSEKVTKYNNAKKLVNNNKKVTMSTITMSTKAPPSHQPLNNFPNPREVEVDNVESDVDYIIESAPASEEATENNKAQKTQASNGTPTDNLFAGLEYIIESGPASNDEPSEDASAHKVKIFHTTPSTKILPLSSPSVRNPKSSQSRYIYANKDYIDHIASAIEDELESISHQINKKFARSKVLKNTRSTRMPHSALSFTNVRDLKPPHGGHVYGEAQYSYHSASNINGKTSEDKGGHKIINNNGKVQEFDFTPTHEFSPLKKVVPLGVLDSDIGVLKSLFAK